MTASNPDAHVAALPLVRRGLILAAGRDTQAAATNGVTMPDTVAVLESLKRAGVNRATELRSLIQSSNESALSSEKQRGILLEVLDLNSDGMACSADLKEVIDLLGTACECWADLDGSEVVTGDDVELFVELFAQLLALESGEQSGDDSGQPH